MNACISKNSSLRSDMSIVYIHLFGVVLKGSALKYIQRDWNIVFDALVFVRRILYHSSFENVCSLSEEKRLD